MVSFVPYDYQIPMIEHLVSNDHAALFVSMGLGKTPCTLEACHTLRKRGEFKGALIVAPLRVAYLVWEDQIKEWGYPFTIANLRTPEGIQAWEDGSCDFYSINFEMISGRGNKKGFLDEYVTSKKIHVDTLIVDELSLLKANTKRTKAVIKARKHFRRVFGLTGTPSPNSLLDLFYPLKVIDGGKRLGTGVTKFKETYFDSCYMGWKFTPKANAEEKIQNLISDICLVKKSEDHLDIPECDFVDVDVSLSKPVMKKYRELEKHLVIQLGDNVVDSQSAATLVNKLQQFTAGIVYDEDKEEVPLHTTKHAALAKILKTRKPVLVLTRYQSEMRAILEAFPEAQKFDEKRMDEWKAGKIPVWVANPASLSHGVNGIQHSCSTLVWMSLTYSLEQYAQTCARILRTGQKDKAKVYRILAQDTIDWMVLTALEGKSSSQSALLESIKILQRANSIEHKSDPKASEPSSESNDPLDSLFGLS